MTRLTATYLVPFRRAQFDRHEAALIRQYLEEVSSSCEEVLVIDGSPLATFIENHTILHDVCRHERVDPRFRYPNGKVNGVHTGVERATCEKIILADDDIRYDALTLRATIGALDDHLVVRPQNYLSPLPLWGRLEAARMLINRATLRAADYPGTCAFRRSTMLSVGHYDGDVLFDNEELIRHFIRSGVPVLYAKDLFVRKQPPAWKKWLEQRPRQAYEDFPLRAKTVLFLSLIPSGLAIATLFGKRILLECSIVGGVGAIGLATLGYTRGKANRVFPWSVCLYAPLWVLERAVSSYWALYWYFRRGGYPFGETILSKGVGRDWIAGGQIASRQLRGRS